MRLFLFFFQKEVKVQKSQSLIRNQLQRFQLEKNASVGKECFTWKSVKCSECYKNLPAETTLTASTAVLPFALTRLAVAPDCSKNVTTFVHP